MQGLTPLSGVNGLCRMALLIGLGTGLGGCNLGAVQELMRQGHAATVDCLHGERAITGGDELRCEDWTFVRENYLNDGQRPGKP
jgi:hypothetical protein